MGRECDFCPKSPPFRARERKKQKVERDRLDKRQGHSNRDARVREQKRQRQKPARRRERVRDGNTEGMRSAYCTPGLSPARLTAVAPLYQALLHFLDHPQLTHTYTLTHTNIHTHSHMHTHTEQQVEEEAGA